MQRERQPVGFYARRQARFAVVNPPRQRRPATNGGPLVEFSSQIKEQKCKENNSFENQQTL